MRLLGFCLLLLFCFAAHAYSQQKATTVEVKISKVNVIVKKDSGSITHRKFDDERVKEYRTQREFKYNDVAPQGESLWTRFWSWFWRIIDAIFSGKVAGNIIKYVLMALVIILIVFIAIKFIKLDYSLFSKKSKAIVVPFE
ncbi:MAG: hypothetical protein EOO07_03005, partial [Chitinophagaceae bacterium]